MIRQMQQHTEDPVMYQLNNMSMHSDCNNFHTNEMHLTIIMHPQLLNH